MSADSPLLLAELRHLGGALGRAAEDHVALSKLDAEFGMFGVGMAMTPEAGSAVNVGLDRLHSAMQPWAGDGGCFNFAERSCDVDAILPPDTCARLREVKQHWDPDGIIRGNHTISLTPA